jgi:hypothetical protein
MKYESADGDFGRGGFEILTDSRVQVIGIGEQRIGRIGRFEEALSECVGPFNKEYRVGK